MPILYCDKLWLQSTFYSIYTLGTLLFSKNSGGGASEQSLYKILKCLLFSIKT